jgi:hypothetical protein
LKGGAFYRSNAPGNESFFYEKTSLDFRVPNGTGKIFYTPIDPLHLPNLEVLNWTVWQAKFIIASSMQENNYLYYHGMNPIENLSLDYHFSQVYDNDGFRIYAR